MSPTKELTWITVAELGKGFNDNGDGTVTVYGKCTDGRLDLDQQIVDQKWVRGALRKWFDEWGNIREMHKPKAVGTALELEEKPDGFYLKACIVDRDAVTLVKHGVFKAFSIGVSDLHVSAGGRKAPGGIIDGGFISETSIVDFPANVGCKFSLATKSFDTNEWADSHLYLASDVLAATLNHTESDERAKIIVAQLGKRNAQKAELSSDERGNLDDSDFAYIDAEGGRHLPIHDEGHLRSALGRFNQTHFDSADDKAAAARKIMAKAKEMGIDVDKDSAVAQAAGTDQKGTFKMAPKKMDKADDDTKTCGTCDGKGTIMDGNRECPDCKGSGKEMSKASKDAESDATKGGGDDKDIDDDVTSAVSDVADDVADLVDDVKALAEAQDKDNQIDSTSGADDMVGDLADDKGKKKGKSAEPTRDDVDYVTTRMHDLVCPAFASKSVLDTYPILAEENGVKTVIDISRIDKGLRDFLSAETIDPTSVAGQARVLAAASKLATLELPEMTTLQDAAHKAFGDAYPDVKVDPINTIMPSEFDRPFLTSATPDVAGSAPANIPSAHPLAPSDFQRGPLPPAVSTANTPSGMQPVRSMAGKGRSYYTNADKDAGAAAAGTLHDYITENHPEVCPMHSIPAHAFDDGQGDTTSAPDMPVMAPPDTRTQDLDPTSALDTRSDAMLTSVGKVAGDATQAEKLVVADAVKAAEQAQAEVRRLGGLLRLQEKRLDAIESRGDPNERAFRGTTPMQFGAKSVKAAKKSAQKGARVAELLKRSKSAIPQVREPAIDALRDELPAEEFAKIITQ